MTIKSFIDSVDPTNKRRNLYSREVGCAEPYAMVLMDILSVPFCLVGLLIGLFMYFPSGFSLMEIGTWIGGSLFTSFLGVTCGLILSVTLPMVEAIIIGIGGMFINYFQNPPFKP